MATPGAFCLASSDRKTCRSKVVSSFVDPAARLSRFLRITRQPRAKCVRQSSSILSIGLSFVIPTVFLRGHKLHGTIYSHFDFVRVHCIPVNVPPKSILQHLQHCWITLIGSIMESTICGEDPCRTKEREYNAKLQWKPLEQL